MKREKNLQYQDEIERDHSVQFIAETYVSNGYYLHFHRNMEVYCVVKGKVSVIISGERKTLTDGQIAIIDGLENHSYEIDGEAEVTYAHIGISYLQNFLSLYPNKRLPHWLLDSSKNIKIYEWIQQIVQTKPQEMTDIRKISIACGFAADVIDAYGVEEQRDGCDKDDELVTKVVQYIYEHYNEEITLESLSKVFYISPKTLSKKISARLNVDLRVFVNDIRVQKAILMLDDPANEGKPLERIIEKCGFNNLRTFYRCYKRNFKFHKM